MAKLAMAEENKRITELCIDLARGRGDAVSCRVPDGAARSGRHQARRDVHKLFLRMRANSIEGGTSEVMRNIFGERVLGLPGDVRTDKGLPWKDVPAELRR